MSVRTDRCKFCGAQVMPKAVQEGNDGASFFIRCPCCGACGPVAKWSDDEGLDKAKARARNLWNRRHATPVDAAPPVVDETPGAPSGEETYGPDRSAMSNPRDTMVLIQRRQPKYREAFLVGFGTALNYMGRRNDEALGGKFWECWCGITDDDKGAADE